MDFFAEQDRARRNTGRLVVLFGLAVIGVILLTNGMAWLLLEGVGFYRSTRLPDRPPVDFPFVVVAGLVTALTLVVITSGTAYKIVQLSGGGHVVARHLRGRLIDPNTAEAHERQVLNIVEEMAIASGLPVPPVYVMDKEASINAFAAGNSVESAVIGVSRGAIERLSRDELQGVMAHEFSHILSGDMRLNLRLIGVLHGILVIGIVGSVLIRIGFYAGRSRDGRIMAMAVVGLGLAIIGAVGTFFGTWIKSAISRQREYLADASAVQFTRNPDGIANALRKIGGTGLRSRIRAPLAAESSHLFFGRALTSGMHSIFSTHPPLERRIRRIKKDWDGKMLVSEALTVSPLMAPQSEATPVKPSPQDAFRQAAPFALISLIGMPTAGHIEAARAEIKRIPARILDAAREPFGARVVIFGLIFQGNSDDEVINLLEEHDAAAARELRRLRNDFSVLDRDLFLPLVELACPALDRLSPEQAEQFLATLGALVTADNRIRMFEWILQRIVSEHVQQDGQGTRVRYYGLGQLKPQCATLLAAVAWAGHDDEQQVRAAFKAGVARLPKVDDLELPARQDVSLPAIAGALDELQATSPPVKKHLIDACAAAIVSDREVTIREAELFRAFAATLGVPVRPLVATEQVK